MNSIAFPQTIRAHTEINSNYSIISKWNGKTTAECKSCGFSRHILVLLSPYNNVNKFILYLIGFRRSCSTSTTVDSVRNDQTKNQSFCFFGNLRYSISLSIFTFYDWYISKWFRVWMNEVELHTRNDCVCTRTEMWTRVELRWICDVWQSQT